jgi:putative ABC transport system permease protein
VRTLALRYVLEDVPRLIASLAGIAFAVALVLVQTGIYAGFVRSTTLLVDDSDAELWVASRAMSYLEITLPVPYAWVARIGAIDGVQHAEPLVLRSAIWQGADGTLDYIRVIGFEPAGSTLRLGVPAAELAAMRRGDVATDAAQLASLHAAGVGARGTIRGLPARVAVLTRASQPIVSPTFLYTTLDSAVAWTPLSLNEIMDGQHGAGSPINYVLVRLRPGANAGVVASAIERALPGARAFPRDEMAGITRSFWVERTKIGFLLLLGATLGVFVGGIVVAQILYASVNEHLREYGTLKALGIGDRAIYGAIALQAVMLAALGYVPGLAIGIGVAAAAAAGRGTPIEITPSGAALAFAVALLTCIAAAFAAVQRAVRVDPALAFGA